MDEFVGGYCERENVGPALCGNWENNSPTAGHAGQ